jgi:hypothetical protein
VDEPNRAGRISAAAVQAIAPALGIAVVRAGRVTAVVEEDQAATEEEAVWAETAAE